MKGRDANCSAGGHPALFFQRKLEKLLLRGEFMPSKRDEFVRRRLTPLDCVGNVATNRFGGLAFRGGNALV